MAYRKDFMDHLGQLRIPANFCKLAFSITLESIGIPLNCLVLIVSGCVVSQGPTRENLQTADSQAKKACSNVWLCSLFSYKGGLGLYFPPEFSHITTLV